MKKQAEQVRILHAPLKAPWAKQNPNAVRRGVRAQRPTSAGLTEAYGIDPTIPGYRTIVESGGRDRRRGQKDNPILTKSSLTSHGSGQIFGCEASTPVRIAPERWNSFSAFAIDSHRVTCHIHLHPHAGVQGEEGRIARGSDRGQKYAEQMDVFADMLDFADAMSWLVVVTADANAIDKGSDPISPYSIMRKHKLEIASHHLDVMAWSPWLDLAVTEVKPPAGVTDHPWLLGVQQ